MSTPQLSVLIATYRPEGILRVNDMHLPQVQEVEYVVSWQEHMEAPIPPALTARSDIRILRFGTTGVSNNRNNAIAHARGDIMLMADDDLIYTPGQLQSVIDTFARHPAVDYASFMYDCPRKKRYPSRETDISTPPHGFYQSCIEVAFRRSPATEQLRFASSFGPGAPYFTCGEDEMLYLRARRMHLECRFFPIEITTHPQPSTGQRAIADPGILRTNGALIALNHPSTFWLRIPVSAWRLQRSRRATLLSATRHMLAGAIHALSDKSIRHYANPTHAAR